MSPAERAEDARLVAAYVAMALTSQREQLRRNGRSRPPAGVDALADLARALAAVSTPASPQPAGDVTAASRIALTLPEAAGSLGVSPSTLRRLVASGDLPTVLLGRSRRVRVADLTAYLERQAAGPAAAPSRSGEVRKRQERSRLDRSDDPGAA